MNAAVLLLIAALEAAPTKCIAESRGEVRGDAQNHKDPIPRNKLQD